MIEKIKKVLLQLGLDKISRKIFKIFFWKRRLFMKFPPYGNSFHKYILSKKEFSHEQMEKVQVISSEYH